MDGPSTIEEVYAYIVVNDSGVETVPVIDVPGWDDREGPVLVPLIAADLARAHALRRYALSSPELQGRTLLLAKFSSRQTVEVLKR